MFGFFRWLFFMLTLALVAMLGYAATLPDSFAVSRTAMVKAPPDKIYPLIANLRKFNGWNPLVLQDPALKLSYSGPQSGVGATCAWTESRDVGAGKLTVTGETPPSEINMLLDMDSPIEAHNKVTFMLRAESEGTAVIWTMSGNRPNIGKVMDVLINMDRMVGSQFEVGLASLKALAGE